MPDSIITPPPGFVPESGSITPPPGFLPEQQAAPAAPTAPAAGAGPAASAAAPAQPIGPGPEAATVGAGLSLVDSILAGTQGTSPHVTSPVYQNGQRQPDRQNYVRLGDLVNTDSGPGVDLGGNRFQPIDPETQVVLRDPETHKLAVYSRNQDMEETRLAALGRILSFGLLGSPLGIAKSGAASKVGQLVQDFEAQKINPTLPAVSDSGAVKAAANAGKNLPFAGPPIAEGAKAQIEQTARAADRAAGFYGTASSPEEAGRGVQSGIEAFRYDRNATAPGDASAAVLPSRVTSFAAKGAELYDRIPVPSGTKANLTNTAETLQGLSSKFASNPEFGKTLQDPRFSTWLDKMAQGGGLTWEELRSFRSYIGDRLAAPSLSDTVSAKDYKTLYGAISQDMQATAATVSPEAAKAAAQADKYWSAGMSRVEDSLSSVFKAASPEQAYSQILTAAGAKPGSADLGKLTALRRSMPDSTWNDVAATVIRQLGKPTPGKADPAGVAFSPSDFITNWSKLSDKGKDVLFSGAGMGEARANLDQLVRVASAEKSVERLVNTSNTATVGLSAGWLASLATSPVRTVIGTAVAAGGARAIMNPGFTKWALALRDTPFSELPNHLARLDALGQADPALRPAVDAIKSGFGAAPAEEGR